MIKKIFFFLLIIFFIFFTLIIIQKKNILKKNNLDNSIKIEKNIEVKETKTRETFNFEKKLEEIEEKNNLVDKSETVEKNEKKIEKTILISTELRGKSLGYFYAYEDGKLIKSGKISSGRKHYETPLGKFKILEKNRYFTSKIYKSQDDRNNMDYMLRLTWGGIALHMGSPNQISHGCIHIAPKDAPWLFKWADIGTTVYITTKKINKNDKISISISGMKEWNDKIIKERNKMDTKITYWPNGNKKSIRYYKGGYLDGVQTDFWENGLIKEKNYYANGRVTGERILFWENGQKRREFYWKNDKLERGMEWDKNGKLTFYFDIKDKY